MKEKNKIPPKLAEQFLSWFCKDELLEEILGDLYEYHEELSEKPNWKRKLLYWFHVINFLRPFALKRSNSTNTNHYAMFRHNFIISFRNFNRYRTSFVINLIGLSTGLACALLIYLWVNDELSMDKFHEKDSRLFQVMEHRKNAEGILTSQTTSAMLGETLAEEMPEVEYAASTVPSYWVGDHTLSTEDINIKATGQYVGSDYFHMFSYSLIDGDENRALTDKNSMVISEELAIKLFNDTENIVGKMVEFDHDEQFLITGIFKGTPLQSSQQFDFILAYDKFIDGAEVWAQSWGNTGPRTYLLLKQGTDVEQFNDKIADYIKTKTNNDIIHRTLFIKPYSEKYLYGKYENGVLTGGRIEYVRLFSLIAMFILVIACINFMNLSTAKASRRIKEIGIKKAMGAHRTNLIFQYLGESLIMTFLSLLTAILLVGLSLPHFNDITAKQLTLNFDPNLILFFLGVTLLAGFVAGSYPALYLSGFIVLKGRVNDLVGEVWARKGLVVFQFISSIILIVMVFVIYKQIEYMQTKNLGYDKENIIYFKREGKTLEEGSMETFLSEVKTIPGIVNASSISHNMTGHVSGTSGVVWIGKDPNDRTEFENIAMNYDMMEVLDIEMMDGRTFSRDFSSDSTAIIFNEAGIEFMGLTNPIGKTVKLWGEDREIIGVAKDFHFESLHEKVKPLFFRLLPQITYQFMAKIKIGMERETINQLREFYQTYNQGFTFDFTFLDENYQSLYTSEQRVATLSKYFAGLAIVISCLGLFGLAAFTAERRTKEIGIRKILGANTFVIVRLLSGDFTRMVLSAIVIALPVSYVIATRWLESFAYRIDIKWWFFAGAGLAALLIAWFTVGIQTLKAARINPADSLRVE